MKAIPRAIARKALLSILSQSSPKTGDVRIRFADGKECTLPIHGIRQLQILSVLDELGVKDWAELTQLMGGQAPSLQAIRFMTKITALALSFPKHDEWTVERIQESFADAEQIAVVFNRCLQLSNLSQAPGTVKPVKLGQKPGAYG